MALAPAERARVATEWGRRVRAEYASGALTAELLHWLFRLGVSPDTIEDAHTIVLDELSHADLSRQVFEAAGGEPDALVVAPELLRANRAPGEPLLRRALLSTCDFYCCGETVARPLFREMERHAREERVRTVLRRVLRDEARHSAFGWELLEELWARADDADRRFVAERVPSFIERIVDGYGGGEIVVPGDDDVSTAERAWGLLPRSAYSRIARSCADDVLWPRFRARMGDALAS